MKALALVSLLLLAAVAGCLGETDSNGKSGTPDPTTGPSNQRYELPEDPMPEGPDHDHADPGQHKFLWNYEFASRDPLMQNAANVAGVHALDVQAGYLFAAVYGSHTVAVDGGLVIWDLADPAHPKQTGRWTIPGSVGGDRSMEATPDGDFAVISTEPVDCAGHVNPAGAALSAYLIDTRDKSLPVAVDVVNVAGSVSQPGQPGGASFHSVAVHRIQDVDYAFLSGSIYRIDRTETGGALTHVGGVSVGHDLYVRDTPWNTTIALAANGGGGLRIYDVTNPASPFVVAEWDLENRQELRADGTDYYFHTADVSFLPDGQVLVVLSSEDWGQTVSPLWVLDGNPLVGMTSDPGEPILLEMLGSWTNPGSHPALQGLTFSLHNPRFHDGGLVTLSSYHGGMWQLDLRHPDFWVNPAPIAYAAYADGDATLVGDPIENAIQQRLCGLNIALDAPSYWDVEIGPDGHVYLADGFMGLYAFKPTVDHPVYGFATQGTYLGTAGT